jgi:sugar (glycoside-pentoside-hexuronide) transporter
VREKRLSLRFKLIYGLGDHSVNAALVSLTMIFPFYLTDVVEMPIGLAGLVPLVGRSVDAVSDVFMGRLSDRTRWKAGRRRPYLLIGALPFALFFAAIWAVPPIGSPALQFAWFAGAYALISLSMTVVAIPYQALLPDLTDDYDERTSLATFRSVLSLIATLLIAVSFRPSVEALGGDAAAWARVGLLFALWILWPWIPIWWVTWERPPTGDASALSLRDYVGVLARNRNFQRLLFLFSLGRIAIDLPLALFLHYFTYVIGHPRYFDGMMFAFIIGTVVAMPIWMRFARGRDKATIYVYACCSWTITFAGLLVLQPDWPFPLMLAISFLSGAGYAAADMMPWSMVADLADEDEIASGERREGIYVGVFTFVRKMSGAIGVALGFAALDLVGFRPNVENSDLVLLSIRGLTAAVPILFILLSILGARRYTLGHAEHDRILDELARRRGRREPA